jgi:death-on-curing protein
MSEFLTLAEVLAIHQDQLDRYGGSDGLRDRGQLEAALFRPQTGYYADTLEEAAALWESLGQNHPFIDGNKRTAFAAMYTFLAINGIRITKDSAQTYAFIAGLYDRNSFGFAQLVAWLRESTVQDQRPDSLADTVVRHC